MARKAIIQQFPPSTAPFLNNDGTISDVWYRFLINSYNREGGSQDGIFDLISLGLLQSAQIQQINGQFDDVGTRLEEFEARLLVQSPYDDQIDALRSEVETLRQAVAQAQQQAQAIDIEAGVQQFGAQLLALSQTYQYASSYGLSDAIAQTNTRIDNLTTDQVPESATPTNLYFTQARARGSISVSGSLSYNSATGVISYTTPSNSATASAWATARTLSYTGDVTGAGSVDGSTNVAFAMTLATVNASPGTFGSSSAVPVVTVNAKGLVTSVTTAALGTAATQNTGTSGASVPLLNGGNTWSALQTFSGGISVGTYTATPGTITGYITINDAGGTPRKIAVTT